MTDQVDRTTLPKRYLGVKIPPTNLQEHHLDEARKFADGLANRLLVSAGEPR
jgi:hypothetical protein